MRAAGAGRQYAPAAPCGRFWAVSTSPLDGWKTHMVTTRMAILFAALAVPMFGCSQSSSEQAADRGRADQLVQQLREFPASLGPEISSNGHSIPQEAQRRRVYAQLRELGAGALPALARGLGDPDLQVRRNVALFLAAAAGGWYDLNQPRLDITACRSALIAALKDGDARVRQLAAQAVGEIGRRAAPAVPDLVALLSDPDEGSRNSACIGLAGIGSAAAEAIPALQRALKDPSVDVRRFAQQAIDRIAMGRRVLTLVKAAFVAGCLAVAFALFWVVAVRPRLKSTV